MFIEFQNLEQMAEYIGYDFPEEIHIVAHHEGFYETDEQGDPYLSVDGMNDFLSRLGADIRVIGLGGGIHCEKMEEDYEN